MTRGVQRHAPPVDIVLLPKLRISVGKRIAARLPGCSRFAGDARLDGIRRGCSSYKPIQSISYQFGSKSTSGYFAQQDGACFIVLMISENSEPGALPPLSPTRARLILYPGETAGLDSEEGHSLNFTCGEAAATLLVTAGDRDRLVALQRAEHVQTAVGPQ